MSRSRALTVAALMLASGALAGCAGLGDQLAKPRGADFLDGAATTLPTAVEGRFSLREPGGRPVTEASYAGRPRLVYFGYTSCPEICGLELDTIARAAEEAGAGTGEAALLFVTVDPERDTPARLEGFTAFFHDDLVGLSGDELQLSRAARSFGAFYRRNDDDMVANYSVDHSTFIYLFDRDGRFVRAFSYKTPPAVIADALRPLLDAPPPA